ncbi:MAG: hypothetical protein ACO3GO_06265, partial [Terrimicrobiaceae bacterium]
STSPCIDGTYIFPAPGFQDNGNGFTTCTVTAYGRNNTVGNKNFSKELTSVYASVLANNPLGVVGSSSQHIQGINALRDKLIWKFVTERQASPNITPLDTLIIKRENGQPLSPLLLVEAFTPVSDGLNLDRDRYLANGYNTFSTAPEVFFEFKPMLVSAESQNFGEFDEWTIVYQATFRTPGVLTTYENGQVEQQFPTTFIFGTLYQKNLPSLKFIINGAVGTQDNVKSFASGQALGIEAYLESNYSLESRIVKIEHYIPSTQQYVEIPADTDYTTFFGGTFRYDGGTQQLVNGVTVIDRVDVNYTHTIQKPADVLGVRVGIDPVPNEISNNHFVWEPFIINQYSDSSSTYRDYEYRLKNVGYTYEDRFLVTTANELEEGDPFLVRVNFVD